ncbi:hypothetical protein BDV28DRAFT_131345 [Aspergillus coremiiformis]|uniref:Uncharacterized protein n=1 Tax=Aspergillus coremiiformis TaxID=138285 RepID=A0A5N6Z9A9_9EURO|nr:hypothetical protein BDV28DRAFT_131345 [Aspergillus coremiiformis]
MDCHPSSVTESLSGSPPRGSLYSEVSTPYSVLHSSHFAPYFVLFCFLFLFLFLLTVHGVEWSVLVDLLLC